MTTIMGTQERRAREFRQREERLLDLATALLLEQGQEAVTMERLAGRAEYAKGTLYKHFGCREDVLCALAARRLTYLNQLLDHALGLEGTPRHRILYALVAYELYAEHHPEEFGLLLAMTSGPISTRASADRLASLDQARQMLFDKIKQLMTDARQRGELGELSMTDDAFCFGLWTVSFGSYVMGMADPELYRRWQLPQAGENLYSLVTVLMDVRRCRTGPQSHRTRPRTVAPVAGSGLTSLQGATHLPSQ